MLSKRILNLHIHYKKLMFSTELKPAVSLCQVKDFAYNVKPSLNRQNNDPCHLYKASTTLNLIRMDLDKFDFSDKNLSGADTVAALSKLVTLCKEQGLPLTEIVNKDFFNNLCTLINSQVDNLTLSETLQCLDFSRKLKVDLSLGYILNLLDHLDALSESASINDFIKIMEVIEKFPSFPSTQQINKCLKQKIAKQITKGYDECDSEFLIVLFKLIYIYNTRSSRMNGIIRSLERLDFNTLPTQSVILLLDSINSAGRHLRDCNRILKKAQNALMIDMSRVQKKDILVLIEKSAVRIKDHGLQHFYNKNLFDRAIQVLVSSRCTLHEGLVCLAAMIDIAHTKIELLNYLSDKINNKIRANQKYLEFHLCFLLLKGYAHFNYKPYCWDEFVNYFKTRSMQKYEIEELLYTAFYLACLYQYEPDLLEAVFKSEFQWQKNVDLHFILLKLYQMLKTAPRYTGPLPSQRQIESFELLMLEKNTHQKSDNSLYEHLTNALGGSEYVKTNVRSKLYHVIDYIAVFQPGGNPVAFNDIKKQEYNENSAGSVEYLENLNIPPDCQIVAIINVPKHWCTKNTNEIMGTFANQLESLEALQCHVVPIKGWERWSSKSRSAFLMNRIRDKLKIKD